MGLDVTHGAWHGAYGAFTRWRQLLAEAAGYAVWTVKFDSGDVMPTVMIDWGHITEENLQGVWARADEPADPLLLLIAHSDCDGHLTPRHARLVAERLEELLPMLPDGVMPGHIGDLHVKTQTFIDGCRAAHKANQRLRFA